MPSYLVEGWFAVVGPAKMKDADVKRINAAVVSAFASPEVVEAMAKQGNTIKVSSPQEAARHFRSEMGKYSAIVRQIGLEPQ
jgi:tripartite-type tricarboxylate transporter receptor subunit TctC